MTIDMKIESSLMEPRLIVVVGTEEGEQSKLAEQLAQIYAFHFLDANDLMNKELGHFCKKISRDLVQHNLKLIKYYLNMLLLN